MVTIEKHTESSYRNRKPKISVLKTCEFYKEAIELVEYLNEGNRNPRVSYKTGGIITKSF